MRHALKKDGKETEQNKASDTTEFMDETNLDYVDTESMVNQGAVPEKNVRYALNRMVEGGPVAVDDFNEALEGASEVWTEYLEKDEHNPREISQSEANAYGAGAAGAGFLSNAPRYSNEVEDSVNSYVEEVENSIGEEYKPGTVRKLTTALLGAEEKAEAELKIK